MRFDREIPVTLKEDAHLIVFAINSAGDLKTLYGTSPQAKLKPQAWHNPFYVDANGDGFKANGDTLGFDIPVAKMSPDVVRAKLGLDPEPAPPPVPASAPAKGASGAR